MDELLERDAEREALAGALAGAARGRGSCVLVGGPAGIGKTRLLDETRALAGGFAVLSARGSELERSFAFGGVQQLLGRVCVPTGGAAAHAAAAFAVDERAQPDHAVLHGLYWLTADLAARRPLLLAVDDAHWLDPPSLRFLAYLANRVGDLRVALVLAARTDQPDELLARLAATRLAPRPLSTAAIAALAAAGGADGALVPALAEATGGVPFYVHALLAERPRTAADVRAATPPEVVDAVALRLASLPQASRRLASALAVLDDLGLAARLAGVDPSAAEPLRRGGFLHPLVRAAIYATLPDRAALHARAAALLKREGAPPERIAAQALAAGPGADVALLRRAARSAHARGAPDVAAAFLRRAHAEAPDDVALARELGTVLVAAEGPPGFAQLRAALSAARGPLRTEIAAELAQALFTTGLFGEAVELLEATLAQTCGADGDGVASALRGRLATIAVLDLDALTRMGGLDGVAALAPPGAAIQGWIAVARSPPAAAGAAVAEAALSEEPTSLAATLMALMAAGRLERAERLWSDVATAARASGALDRLRLAIALRALVRLRLGRVADVEADLRELLAWVTELQLPGGDYRVALPWVVAPLVDALVERGQLEEAQTWLSATGLESDWPRVFAFTFLLDTLGRLRLAQGRRAEATALLRECGRRQEAWGIRNPGFIPWRSSLALALGGGEEARALCEREIALARAFGVAREHGMALRAAALVADDGTRSPATAEGRARAGSPTATGADVDLLRAAVDVLAGSPARLEHARALADLGAATGQREPLREAVDLAVRCGATALAERAHRALIATGARPRRAPLTGARALTAAQLRVATLAADGRTNREIAETLFLTEKTVEGHLGQAYRKLGIASRTQLASALSVQQG